MAYEENNKIYYIGLHLGENGFTEKVIEYRVKKETPLQLKLMATSADIYPKFKTIRKESIDNIERTIYFNTLTHIGFCMYTQKIEGASKILLDKINQEHKSYQVKLDKLLKHLLIKL